MNYLREKISLMKVYTNKSNLAYIKILDAKMSLNISASNSMKNPRLHFKKRKVDIPALIL